MNSKQQRPLKKLLGIRGMGAALTAFVGLIIIYIAFGIINPAVFSGQNMLNLLRSMSKYLLIGIAQSYVLITGNIDLSIGSMVGMSAMIAATLMTTGMVPFLAIVIALIACLVVGVVNGYLERQRHMLAQIICPIVSSIYCNSGNHVRSTRNCLHGKRKQKYRCHCNRCWKRNG